MHLNLRTFKQFLRIENNFKDMKGQKNNFSGDNFKDTERQNVRTLKTKYQELQAKYQDTIFQVLQAKSQDTKAKYQDKITNLGLGLIFIEKLIQYLFFKILEFVRNFYSKNSSFYDTCKCVLKIYFLYCTFGIRTRLY